MKYSLRSLMIVVLVLPPLLAWFGMPLYRWYTTPKARSSLSITKPNTTPPTQQGTFELSDPREPVIGYPSEAKWKEIMAGPKYYEIGEIEQLDILPNSPAPAPNPPKP